MKHFLLAAGLGLLAVCAQAQTPFYADASKPDDSGDGLSWETAKQTIQAAVDAAPAGSLVLVAEGTYDVGTRVTPGTNLFCRLVLTNDVTVRGNAGPDSVIIVGAGTNVGLSSVRCVYMSTGVLENVTLSNGFTLAGGGLGTIGTYGGGLYAAGGFVSNCVIKNCGALYGGGAYQARMASCRIVGNWATYRGGGVHTVTMDDCEVSTNRVIASSTSGYAGGVYGGLARNCLIAGNTNAGNYGGAVYSAILSNCVIKANYGAGYGGGAYLGALTGCTLDGNISGSGGGGAHSVTLIDCTIRGNTCVNYDGGGTFQGTATDCLIEGNSATRNGGGSYLTTLSNCTVRANTAITSGGGAYAAVVFNSSLLNNQTVGNGGGTAGGRLYNCLLAGNSAQGLGGGAFGSTQQFCTVTANKAPEGAGVYGAFLRNSIVWENRTPSGPLDNYNPASDFSNACSYPLPAGPANSAADPLFVSAAAGDYRLRAGSPALDEGVPADAPGSVDLAGEPRLQGAAPDLGAYEGALSGAVVTVQIIGTGSVSPRSAVLADAGASAVFTASGALPGRSFIGYKINGSTVGTDPELVLSGIAADTVLEAVFETATVYADAAMPDDSGDGTGWLTAKRTLQAAVDLAQPGDRVLAADGLYGEGGGFTPGSNLWCRLVLTNSVTVASQNGPGGAVIVGAPDPVSGNLGTNAVRGVYIASGLLSGFTISNGFTFAAGTAPGSAGGGVFGTGGLVSNCVIRNCRAPSGGGLYGAAFIDGSIQYNYADNGGGACAGVLVNSAVYRNKAAVIGGGLYLCNAWTVAAEENAAPTGAGAAGGFAEDCVFSRNKASGNGGGAYNGTLYNCRLEGNQARMGGGAQGGRLQNCLLNGNFAKVQGGGANDSALTFCTVAGNISYEGAGLLGGTAWNTVVWANRRPNGEQITNDSANVSFVNSCVLPAAPGAGNIAADPRLVGADAGVFQLRPDSPCLDGAEGALLFKATVTDLAGQPRTQGSAPDMGAYEGAVNGAVVRLQVSGAGTVSPSDRVIVPPAGSATVTATALNPARPFVRYVLNGVEAGTDPELILSAVPDGSLLVAEFQRDTWYADPAQPDDSGDGTSWGTAKQTLQAAVDLALAGDTVLAANGKYGTGTRLTPGGTLPCRLVVTNDITVRSLNGRDVAIIAGKSASRGTASVRGVYMSAGTLQGFRIETGTTFAVTLPAIDAYGGGLFVPEFARVTVVSSEVTRCLAEYGAGVYALGDFDMEACIVSSNTATYSVGGLYGGTVRNSIFIKNSASYAGGGVHSATAFNCQMIANSCTHNSSSGGGGVHSSALYNCSVVSNLCNRAAAGISSSDAFECFVYKNRVTRSDNLSTGGGTYGGFISHCWIEGNQAVSSSGAHGGTLRNCVIFRNLGYNYTSSTTGYAGGAYGANLVNCVVAYNLGPLYGGTQGGTVSNSIVLYNTVYSGIASNYSSTTFRYSATFPLPAGDGNIEVSDPNGVFVDGLNGLLRLRPGSPCINAGTNNVVAWPYDLDGLARIFQGRVDMGAYESMFSGGTVILIR